MFQALRGLVILSRPLPRGGHMGEIDDAVLKIKSWWKSVTVWLAATLVAVSQLGSLLPMLAEYMDPTVQRWLGTIIGISIIWDRLFRTNQAVTAVAARRPVASDKVVSKDTSQDAGA